MAAKYDVVWYWSAAPRGEGYRWAAATPGVWPEFLTVDQLVENLGRAGYPAVRGLLSVGAPEGAPDRS